MKELLNRILNAWDCDLFEFIMYWIIGIGAMTMLLLFMWLVWIAEGGKP